MRVFVPATVAGLGRLHADGTLPVTSGFAVTAGLRAAFAEDTDDDEELEFIATAYAA